MGNECTTACNTNHFKERQIEYNLVSALESSYFFDFSVNKIILLTNFAAIRRYSWKS